MVEFAARYASDAASATLARHAVVDFARVHGFCDRDLADIECGVGEALGNAVEHGHRPSGLLRLRCRFEAGTLDIEVQDRGTGFDPEAVPAPAAQSSTRGFGIYIMRSLMDRVEFRRGGRLICLVKRKNEDCPCQREQNFAAHAPRSAG